MNRLLANTLLVLCAILLGYALLEAALRFTLPHLPRQFFNNQCKEFRILGQSSKQGLLPAPGYLAVLGDSYAAGQGDWFIQNRYNPDSQHQATHLLHQGTGRDALAFARPGGGSYDVFAVFVPNSVRFLRRAGFDLPDPAHVVVYFYEGNDVSDNLGFLQRHFTPAHHEPALLADDATFKAFARDMEQRYCQGRPRRFEDIFLAANAVVRFFEGLAYSLGKQRLAPPPGTKFKARIGGAEIFLPDEIEADLSRYSEVDLEHAVLVFSRALHQLDAFWPESRKYVAYIPCPRTMYDISGADAARQRGIGQRLEAKVAAAAQSKGFLMLDTAEDLRRAAAEAMQHGPKDVNHLNRAGYATLAMSIAAAIDRGE
jgi:GNAT superfamily N-acetyltransferase